MPHRLVMAPIYDLPFGKGKKYGANWNPIVNGLLGGWQLATVGTIRTGGYFGGLVDGGPNLRGDIGAGVILRPDVTGQDFKSASHGTPAEGVIGWQFLNPDSLTEPAQFQLGDSSRTLPGIRGPGRINFDMMLAKNFRWSERWRAQFRWEAFNMTNTPAFNTPNASVGSGNYGLVTGTLPDSRRIMQLGLRITF